MSAAAAVVGTSLQLKPLLHVAESGELEVADRTLRGTRRAMGALLDRMRSGWDPETCPRVVVGHGDCPETAQELVRAIESDFPQAEITVAPIGPVIGSHTGPGLLAVVFWGSMR